MSYLGAIVLFKQDCVRFKSFRIMYNLSRSDYAYARSFLLSHDEDLAELEPFEVINLANHVYGDLYNAAEQEGPKAGNLSNREEA